MPPDWLWIPITLFAAGAQTARNAAQRHLTGPLGTLGATLVRFLYGVPFALAWLLLVHAVVAVPLPAPNAAFLGWIVAGGVAQIGATALLLQIMAERNFALGIAYSKTEIMQIAVFGLVFLGDPISPGAGAAVLIGTLGVLLMSPLDRQRPLRALLAGWTSRVALLGFASGAGFGIASVGYRGAALALEGTPFVLAAAYALVAAQMVQTLLLGGLLLARDAAVIGRVVRAWRASLFAGLMGATASAGWFTAFAIEPAAHVRTLALVEIFFAYVVSRRLFREHLNRLEIAGMALLGASLATVTLVR